MARMNCTGPALLVLLLTAYPGCASSMRASGEVIGRVRLNESTLRGQCIDVRQQLNIAAPADDPDFDDPRSVLRFVVMKAPQPAVVYPSERYYYYEFALGSRLVSGNIRFVDAEDGGISIGYFDALNGSDMKTGEFRDGVDGVSIDYDPSRHAVTLGIDDVDRTFILDQSAFEQPDFPMLDGEQFISGIRDESGYYLFLFYYHPGRCFYYVLNTSKPIPETWSRGESNAVEAWFGDTSRFCFLRHEPTGRFILVGVHRHNIAFNTWYDGPFDQVPPRLNIGSILEEAYPYVIDAGGIDTHGNFLESPGQRVAISPYRDYDSGASLLVELQKLVRDAPTPEAWTAATYEHKRDWRPAHDNATGPGHEQAVSRSWPANHWGHSSQQWGAEHQQTISAGWPPNHSTAVSRSDVEPQ